MLKKYKLLLKEPRTKLSNQLLCKVNTILHFLQLSIVHGKYFDNHNKSILNDHLLAPDQLFESAFSFLPTLKD